MKAPKSPRSTRATDAPRPARDAADHRAVDAGADDEDVEVAVRDPCDVGPPQRHGLSVGRGSEGRWAGRESGSRGRAAAVWPGDAGVEVEVRVVSACGGWSADVGVGAVSVGRRGRGVPRGGGAVVFEGVLQRGVWPVGDEGAGL